MKTSFLAAFFAFTTLALGACGVPDKVDGAVDCAAICGRYESCFDSDFDSNRCEDRCRDESARDKDYRRKADVCHACINDRDCAGATWNCAADCAGIVP